VVVLNSLQKDKVRAAVTELEAETAIELESHLV